MPSQIGKRSSTTATDTGPRHSAETSSSTIGKRTVVEDAYAAPVQLHGASGASSSTGDGSLASAERDTATARSTLPHYSAIRRVFGRHDKGAGPVQRMDSPGVEQGDTADVEPAGTAENAEAARLAEVEDRARVQLERVKQKVRTELGYYEEISRVIAQEAAAGRLHLSDADFQRFDAMNRDLEEVAELVQIPLSNDTTGQLAAADLLGGMEEAKRHGNDLMDAHASAILPCVREIDALNFLVQNRLERLATGYSEHLNEARTFQETHESGVGVSESVKTDWRATVITLRQLAIHARAETKVEANMMQLLGAALLGEAQAKADGVGKRVHSVFSTKRATRHRTEKSAIKRKTEIEGKFGDLYEASAEGGEIDLKVRPEAVGSVPIVDLENRMDAVLAADKPRFVARAVRAAVDSNPDFERVEQRRMLGKSRESVVLSPDTFSRLHVAEAVSGPAPAPRDRMLEVGLNADSARKLNDLKFSLSRDAREAIDAEYHKSQRWLNFNSDLTQEKVALLWRTMDAIIAAQRAEAMLRAIDDAKREHGQLWRERGMSNGGETSQTLERWADAVARFMS